MVGLLDELSPIAVEGLRFSRSNQYDRRFFLAACPSVKSGADRRFVANLFGIQHDQVGAVSANEIEPILDPARVEGRQPPLLQGRFQYFARIVRSVDYQNAGTTFGGGIGRQGSTSMCLS